METTTFSVPSISCSSCAQKIQDGLKSLSGIENAKVDLNTQTVSVDYEPDKLQPPDIKRKVISMGYEVT